MKQKFLIFGALIFLVIVLVGLNAASYVQKEKTPDSEFAPNRSTFNAGATGTRALYDLLTETGRKPTRWQEPTSALLIKDKNRPQTFVVIGRTRREFEDKEIEELLRWVSEGGKLVIIDRDPPEELIKTTANWSISADKDSGKPSFFNLDPSDVKQMTDKTVAAKPVQPTVYTNRVNAVQPSQFASSITFEHFIDNAAPKKSVIISSSNTNQSAGDYDEEEENEDEDTPPISLEDARKKIQDQEVSGISTKIETPAQTAPVAHLANDNKTLLVDFPFGSGQIVFLTDPYIVSNGGIGLVDNAQLAINLIASREGIVAFDEFHQGYGAGQNHLLTYFEGTPVVAVFLQIVALAGLILFSQSRRFARPLPENEPNRLSKLEYVAAMAELQQRTKAFDLAMENIYKDFRRRVARLVGADALKTSPAELARMIAERTKLNQIELENLLANCEAIMHGEPTNKREMVDLTAHLRQIEETLGLQRRKRQNTGN